MAKFNQKYSIGLDIGVSSVGYAVVTEDHKVPSFKFRVFGETEKKYIKKNLIGSTIFESAEPAQDTRLFRTSSRRLERRNNRIKYLREIFKEEIDKVDKNFYRRLDETFRIVDDKSDDIRIKHPFFGKKDLEKEFHQQYPTIYHLRKYLADMPDTEEKADIREVYMALSHILKYRGNFLTTRDINPNNIDIKEKWKDFVLACQECFDMELPDGYEEFYTVLKEKLARKDKVKTMVSLFPKEESKKDTSVFKQLLHLLFGLSTKFKVCFELDEEPDLDFLKENYDEKLSELLCVISDDFSNVFACLKSFNDTLLLSDMLTHKGGTHARFSATMIDRYEEHRKDLQRLKSFVKQNLSEQDYLDIFGKKTEKGFVVDKEIRGYAGYINNKTKIDDFYSYLSNKIKMLEGADYFLDKIEHKTLLRKLRTVDNGAIPNQIHAYEFVKIIDRQGKNYPFLLENKEKLLKILTVRIPYFVGPLAQKDGSRFSWYVKNEAPNVLDSDDEDTKAGKIRPWNIDQLVNMNETRKEFINNLIGEDTVLLNKKVLPKRSLIYEELMLHNELTRVKYKNKYGKTDSFKSDVRKAIIKDLFKDTSKRVTVKQLVNYLQNCHDELKVVEIVAGVRQSFNASLKTYNDFKNIFSAQMLDSEEYQNELEEIVKIITVFEDKKSIKDYFKKNFSNFLSDEQIDQLSKLRYKGWGEYSQELLTNIRDEDTGFNLLQFVRTDDRNRNLQQLISDDKLSFKHKISEIQSQSLQSDTLSESIKEIAGSPALKRGILNSIKIVDELVDIIGYPPQKIVIEMARENMTTEEGKKKSKPRKTKLEQALKRMETDLLVDNGKNKGQLKYSNEELQSEKLYLYCLQNGKDMYSLDKDGNPETIDYNQLNQYEVDHIIPYSHLPIDSIDNKVLTRRINNQNKEANIPNKDIVRKMKPFWEQLYEAKLISQVKFQRLTTAERTPNGVLTEDMKAGFIERQLVETRQIIKHVARILDGRFESSKIVTLKSQLVSNFRNTFHLPKIRELNDYHHAHDAYLNVVIAQTLLKAYPKLAPELVYGQYRKFNRHEENKATVKKHLYSNVMKFFNSPETKVSKEVWSCSRDLPIIKKVLYKSQINFVKRTVIKKGGFFNQNPVGQNSTKLAPENLYPIKQGLNPSIYGGYGPLNSALSVLIIAEKMNNRTNKTKLVKELHDIDIIDYKRFNENPIDFLNSPEFLSKNDFSRVKNYIQIPKYSLVQQANGGKMMIESSTNLHKATQFKLTESQSELFYHMKRYLTKSNLMDLKDEMAVKESVNFIEQHSDEFDKLAEAIFNFSRKYLGETAGLKSLESGYNNRNFKDFQCNDEVVRYYYENFLKMFEFVKSGVSRDIKTYFSEKNSVARPRYKPNSKLLSATLIHQSITGLYETRIDLSKWGEE
ncbi:type II CRISPR RNA-guided endonuclease Cas9 [Streptococcus ovis]|uniref:type II CRISPR RNA-guided endonuclease Cas9 n=1 Tax=Streptococcus ovis TaxID=82806 RepID=UPI0003799C2C|nr:type II CRISPR RNA-guided endonuclease Cas9 [Streptococcus ovis]